MRPQDYAEAHLGPIPLGQGLLGADAADDRDAVAGR